MGFEKLAPMRGTICITDEDFQKIMDGASVCEDCSDEPSGIKIRRVIFHGPATIVYWDDGDKTVVKCMEGDHMNYGMGIAMCTLKKLFGDSYGYFKQDLKKWTPEQKESEGEPWHIIVNTEDSKKIAKNPQKFADAFGEFLQRWDSVTANA